MSEAAPIFIVCPACGKKYRARAELAGKNAKCACGSLIPVPTVSAAQAQPPASVLGYKTPGSSSEFENQYFPDKVKDFQIPMGILCAGIVIQFLAGWISQRGKPGAALTEVGVTMLLDTGVMLVAILIAGKLRGIKFGPFWAALLKLSAVSIGPDAGMTFVYFFLRYIPFGGIITWISGFMFYFALIGMFFDLDQSDTWYCVIVIFIVKVAIFFAIMTLWR